MIQIGKTLTPSEAARLLPQRAVDANKRSVGSPLIIAGSAAYPGAAILCSRAAARTGAGYVTVATPISAASILHNHLLEQVVVGYDERSAKRAWENIGPCLGSATAIAIGPGLETTPLAAEILKLVIKNSRVPLVIDAGALRLLPPLLSLLKNRSCVLTPHDSEFLALQKSTALPPEKRPQIVADFARRHNVVTLLKGNVTYIASSQEIYENTSGTSALATAGTGDVLTGIIATLLAQGLSAIDAARLGAYLHGLAGREGEKIHGRSMIAGDVSEALRYVWPLLPCETNTIRLSSSC